MNEQCKYRSKNEVCYMKLFGMTNATTNFSSECIVVYQGSCEHFEEGSFKE